MEEGEDLERLYPIFPKEEESRRSEDTNLVENARGEYWKDERIKNYTGEEDGPTEPGFIVEGRLGDKQPTVEEDVGYNGFLLGRTAYAQENEEPILPFKLQVENRKKATTEGMEAELWYVKETSEGFNIEKENVRDQQPREIEKAREGLEELGIDPAGYLWEIEKNLAYGTPSDRAATQYVENRSEQYDLETLAETVNVIGDHEFENLETGKTRRGSR